MDHHHHNGLTTATKRQKSREQLTLPPVVSQSVYSHYQRPGIKNSTNVHFSQREGPKRQFSDDIWFKHHQVTRQYIHGPDMMADVYNNNNKRDPTATKPQPSKFKPACAQQRFFPQITQRHQMNITTSLPAFSAVENQYQLLGNGFRDNPFRWQRKHLYHRAWKWFV